MENSFRHCLKSIIKQNGFQRIIIIKSVVFNEYWISILHYYCYSMLRMGDRIKIHVSLGILVHLPVQAKCYKIEWMYFTAADYKKVINTVVTLIAAFVTRHGLNGTCIEPI